MPGEHSCKTNKTGVFIYYGAVVVVVVVQKVT